MFFTSLGEQKRNAEFHYSDLIGGDLCSKMAYLIAKSGGNKGQSPHLVEAVCLNFLNYYLRYHNYLYVAIVITATSLP